MNLDFPAVPGKQTRTLEELQGMKTVNKVDEAYNVVPTGASCLNEQKSASVKKDEGHIVEEVAGRAVKKQGQCYEADKKVKEEIVEHTEVQEQTPNMPVPFINTTSQGAGQLSRKIQEEEIHPVSERVDMVSTGAEVSQPVSDGEVVTKELTMVYTEYEELNIGDEQTTFKDVAGTVVKVQPQFCEEEKKETPIIPDRVYSCSITRGNADKHNKKVVPARLNTNIAFPSLADEVDSHVDKSTPEKKLPKVEACELVYDHPKDSKKRKDIEDESSTREKRPVKKAKTDSQSFTEQCNYSIMRKLREEQPFSFSHFYGIPFEKYHTPELFNLSDLTRVVPNVGLYEGSHHLGQLDLGNHELGQLNEGYHHLDHLNEGNSYLDQFSKDKHVLNQLNEVNNDLVQLNEDINALDQLHDNQGLVHLNVDNLHINQSNIDKQYPQQSARRSKTGKRKFNALGCEVSDISSVESTLESETVDSPQEETKSKKSRQESCIKNNRPNPDVYYSRKGKRPVRGKQHIKGSCRKESVPQNTPESTTKSHEMHAPASVIGPPPLNKPSFAIITDSGANDEAVKTDDNHNMILLNLKKKVSSKVSSKAKTAVADVQFDKQLSVRPGYNETHCKDREQQHCKNIPNFTLIDPELFKGSAEEQKTGQGRIVLKLVKNQGKWEIKKDPPDSNDYVADGDEDMPELQTSFEGDITGISTETNVPSYHYRANSVVEDDEQTLLYGFDGPFGRIIEN